MYSPADSHPFPPSYTGSTEALSPAGDFFFFFFFWPTVLPWSCLTAAAQQVIRSPRLAVRSGAPYPPLPQTCASGSSREAPFQLHPSALLFNVHIKGVKESTRSALVQEIGSRASPFSHRRFVYLTDAGVYST